VERGSDKHSPRQDDELKSELAGLIGEAGGHREEWRDPEPPGQVDPARARGGSRHVPNVDCEFMQRDDSRS